MQTVHLLGRYPVEAMPNFFALSDVLLVTLKKEPIFALTIPSKVQSYLACAKPIIAALDGLEKGLIRMLGNPDKLHFMGENLKRHIKQHYVWDTVIGKYNDLYNQILKSP